MSEPTLLDDLEAAIAWADDPNSPFAARLRAHAARLRDEIRAAESERHEHADARRDLELLTRINGGSPVSPGAARPMGTRDLLPGERCTNCRHGHDIGHAFADLDNAHWTAPASDERYRCEFVAPASPPTTPTCASWCGTGAFPGRDVWFHARDLEIGWCTVECMQQGRPLHPRTP